MFEAIPEEKMIREFVRQVAKQYDREYWLTKAREGAFPDELWQEMGAGGYLGMMIPEEHGGGGLGLQQMAVLLEEMGQHGIPLLLLVVGNVMQQDLDEIWNSRPYLELRRSLAKRNYVPTCANCNVVRRNALLYLKPDALANPQE